MQIEASYSCTSLDCVNQSFLSVTAKFDASGIQLWASRYTDFPSQPNAIAVDLAGNVYVTGVSCIVSNCTTPVGTSGGRAATIKYSSNGTQLWVVLDGNVHAGVAIAVNASGNVFITGTGHTFPPSANATISYDTDGNPRWVASGLNAGGAAIVLDIAGNVHVTGQYAVENVNSKYATTKYTSNGNQLWTAIYSPPNPVPSSYAKATAIALDSAGNVYVTGTSECVTTCDISSSVTLKYDSNGNQRWLASQDFVNSGLGPFIAVGNGSVFFTGSVCSDDTCLGNDSDILTVKYTPPN